MTGPTDDPVISAVEAELAAQLLDVGIVLQVTNVPEADLLDTVLPEGSYQLALAPYELSAYPSDNATYYHSPVTPIPVTPVESVPAGTGAAPATKVATGGAPLSGNGTEPDASAAGSVTRDVLAYSDPAVSSLFAEAAEQLNPLATAGRYNEADTKLWLDLPSLPLFQVPVEMVSSGTIVNLCDPATPAGPLWNAEDWAIKVLPPPTTTTSPTGNSTTTSGAPWRPPAELGPRPGELPGGREAHSRQR